MSMEQAILELAAAMREQAAAQRESNEVQRATAAGYERAVTAYAAGEQRAREEAPAEPKKDVQAEPTPAEPAAQTSNTPVAPSDELEAAVSKVEEESKALDYKTDVRPVLLALAKKAGQPALKDLLTKYGAATGDKLTADQFAGIVADANALIAG